MKVLLVHYLPRGERSRTRRLVEAARRELAGATVEDLDLAATPPLSFDVESLNAYMARNYAGQPLSETQRRALEQADALVEQIRGADAVVLAFPMYNFSVPAAVKAWMDAVMQKGRTWAVVDGQQRGLLEGRRALVLMTAGGVYDRGPRIGWDHASPLARHAFEFMGFSDITLVKAEGLNADPAGAGARLIEAEKQTTQVLADWLSRAPVVTH